MSTALPPAYVINLDRAPERWARIVKNWPPELPLHRFAAVDGDSQPDIHDIGAIRFEKPAALSSNEYACLLSHVALWHQAANSAAAMMILEDDAFVPPDFAAHCAAFMAKLPADYDIAYLTYNTDMHVHIEMPGAGRISIIHEEAHPPAELLASPGRAPHPYRLYRAWGLPAYIISQKGAAKLLAHFTTPPPAARHEFLLQNGIGNECLYFMPTGPVDLRVLTLLPSLEAYVAIPMLCLPDLVSLSTIGGRSWEQRKKAGTLPPPEPEAPGPISF